MGVHLNGINNKVAKPPRVRVSAAGSRAAIHTWPSIGVAATCSLRQTAHHCSSRLRLLSTTRPTRARICRRTKPLARQRAAARAVLNVIMRRWLACLGLTALWAWRGL
jgi:hypothetical protein